MSIVNSLIAKNRDSNVICVPYLSETSIKYSAFYALKEGFRGSRGTNRMKLLFHDHTSLRYSLVSFTASSSVDYFLPGLRAPERRRKDLVPRVGSRMPLNAGIGICTLR